ncbi:hypothetical protein ASD55_05030 [Rhodanobacter sp. Root561]|uniref:hypothetical protein n=1 Tax=Rhodanobacter sp. Root561 TaxID=1736560 RepID=UPI0007019413|nr:hypothetical protein [Rhodanobacter sp. Root561]KQZ80048.1 hypothetical protein ASD55_05030 [Rhodanobacter sp. Root561]
MGVIPKVRNLGCWILISTLLLVALVYSTGLRGGWLFDDYPNIVDNQGVHPVDASIASLVRAALSSPASEFKRPLASLSFAANYLVSGLDPYSWKLTNLIIHLMNGVLVFLLTRGLLLAVSVGAHPVRDAPDKAVAKASRTRCIPTAKRAGILAALIAGAWMLLPINLSAVLYVVQRMESIANLFVLTGLLGYVIGRRNMLAAARRQGTDRGGLMLCIISVIVATALGLLAKETAVMLPLYALLIEWVLFRFGQPQDDDKAGRPDWRIVTLFVLVLALPMAIGLAWLLPGLFKPSAWATRDFTLGTRLLSEARIVTGYIGWTLFPTPSALSFYHDDFRVSTGLLAPRTTLASVLFLAGLVAVLPSLRRRQPLAALGLALFLGCHLLTGTILPLELVYEHRNYFASFGLLLATVPVLAAPRSRPLALPRNALLAGLMLCWTALTAFTAYAWGNPLRLAEDLASRAPRSPRAQYELGRTYIIYSHYDPSSPFTRLAYAPLEAAARLPDSSILPEQALIFMNARMGLPLKDAWWNSMIGKLKAHPPGVQDESSLSALTQCARDGHCMLPTQRMTSAFEAARSHPLPSARLLATYGDYAWNVLDNRQLGETLTAEAVRSAPNESAYQITLIRMLIALGRKADARRALQQLETLNIGGRLNLSIAELESSLAVKAGP